MYSSKNSGEDINGLRKQRAAHYHEQSPEDSIRAKFTEARELMGRYSRTYFQELSNAQRSTAHANLDKTKAKAKQIKNILLAMQSSASQEAKHHIEQAINSCNNCISITHHSEADSEMFQHLDLAEQHFETAMQHHNNHESDPPRRGRHHHAPRIETVLEEERNQHLQ